MKEMKNKVNLQGTLVDYDLEQKVDGSGKKFIAGEVMVKTDAETIVPVSCFAYELKKDGAENKGYKSINKVMTMNSIAITGAEQAEKIKVSLAGLRDQSFYLDREDKVIPNWGVTSMFFNSVGKDSENFNDFEIEGVVSSIKETTDEEGNETGEYILKLLNVGYADRVMEVPLTFNSKEAVDYITSNYNNGDLGVFTGVIEYKSEEVVVEKKVTFGEPVKKTYNKTIRRLVITGGTEAVEPEEHEYNLKDLQTRLEEHKKDITEKGKARAGNKAKQNVEKNKEKLDQLLF